MPVSDIVNRYPLSTPNGQSIPLDVVKPIGLLRINFNSSSFTSATDLASTYADKVFIATTTEDCYIHIGATPAVPVSGIMQVDTIFIPAGATLSFVMDSLKIAAIGVTAVGRLDIQICETWAGLAIAAQINRI